MPLQPSKHIAKLKLCAHGGIDYAEIKSLGIDPADLVDFSVSTNPYMPPESLKEIIAAAPVARYPDSQSTALRCKLAEKLGVQENNIIAGNGTTELIRLIAQAFITKESRPLILEPVYGEYETACLISGASPVRYRTSEKHRFVPDIDKVIKVILAKKPGAVFICNPNNPTGHYLPRHDLVRLLEAAKNSLVIIDEAYVHFVEKTWDSSSLLETGNIVILRSMTKDYSIPGLRLGYALASRSIIGYLNLVKPPWNVNTAAQQVGIALLENDSNLLVSLEKTRRTGKFLREELQKLGLEILPSDAHFFLVKVADSTEFRQALLTRGIMVRDCTSFGLPQYIRISPRTIPECEKLLASVKTVLKENSDTIPRTADKL